MSEVISPFKNLRAGSQVVAILMLFLCVILHTMWSAIAMHLGMLCLSAINMMFVKNYVASVYVGGYGGLSENGLCVFLELCAVSFLVFDESPSVVL